MRSFFLAVFIVLGLMCIVYSLISLMKGFTTNHMVSLVMNSVAVILLCRIAKSEND